MRKNILLSFFILFLVIFVFWALSNNKNKKDLEEEQVSQQEQTMQELQMEIMQMGSGVRETKNGDVLIVHYTGTLQDGTKFDSSLDRSTPFEFTLGAGNVIKGWDNGLFGMKVGEKRKLIIPPRLAYGSASPSPLIPADSTLIFEVELLEIK